MERGILTHDGFQEYGRAGLYYEFEGFYGSSDSKFRPQNFVTIFPLCRFLFEEEISRNFIPGIWKDMFRRTQFTDKEIDWVVENTEIWFKRLSENQKKAFDWDVFDGPEKSTWYLFHAVYFIGKPGEFCQKLEAAQNRRLKRRDKAKIQYLIKVNFSISPR